MLQLYLPGSCAQVEFVLIPYLMKFFHTWVLHWVHHVFRMASLRSFLWGAVVTMTSKRTFFFWAGGMMWKFLNTGCLIKNSSSGETELADFFTKLDNRLLKPFSLIDWLLSIVMKNIVTIKQALDMITATLNFVLLLWWSYFFLHYLNKMKEKVNIQDKERKSKDFD